MTILKAIGLVVAGMAVGSLVSASGVVNLGGVYNQVNNTFREGIKIGTNDQFKVDADGNITTDVDVDGDVTVSGGSLTVTTGASATSTLTTGCVTTYATSSVTPVKLVFVSTTTLGTNGIGYFVARYGDCP